MNEKSNKIGRYITTISDFQFAVNIGYDLYSDDKIKNYIPTSSAIELIEDVMLGLSPSSNDRARIFIGAYGKGKSHLTLMLVSLLFRKEPGLFDTLLSKVYEYNVELYNYISDYINSDRRLLPVIVYGNGMGIRQSLMFELKRSLENAGLRDIMPDTYFKAAMTTIQNWEKDYKETYFAFENKISCSVSDFILGLSEYNTEYYVKFTEIFPSLTSGSEYNPISVMNVVELYNDVNDKIKKHGYNGIFVVYDEFSKFLEGSLNKTSAEEVKALQDFAENCTRSKEKQLHILLVSHKSILNYIDKLPKNKIDAWKAVSNRFKTVELNNTSAQMYEVISHVIKQKEDWYETFKNDNNDIFHDIFEKWRKHRVFSELTDNELENVVFGCYPLEPITTFLLPRISEKIAQNERTLFTFLSVKGQKLTLSSFLATAEARLPLLTPDYIYDYFEPLFKAENYNSMTHKLWKTTSVALNKLTDKELIEKKMVKGLSLVYILNQFEILPPDMQMLIDVYNGSIYDMDTVVKALSNLVKKGILSKHKNHLRIAEHTDVNIDELIENIIAKRSPTANVKDILNSFTGDKVLYPNAYNDENEIIRYFVLEFITIQEIEEVDDWSLKIQNISGDGIVYTVITNDRNISEIIPVIREIKHNRIVFITPKSNEDIYGTAIRYDAIKHIIETTDDHILADELSYYQDDFIESLNGYVDMYLRPELSTARYYYKGEELSINRRSALSRKLSTICAEVFIDCPVINNEVINKNNLSSQAINSRAKVVAGLLENIVKPDLGLTGTSQDVSFMRSTIKSTGILVSCDDKPILTIEDLPDARLQVVLNSIRTFFLRSTEEGRMCFKELYDILTLPENRIGLKKGVIPIYIASVLHFYKRYTVITRGNRELEITTKLLESINEKPDDYELYLENWDEQKEEYINTLERIFTKHINEYEKEYNSFEYIARAMQRWFLQLPKYTKEIERRYTGDEQFAEIELCTLKLKNGLRTSEINSRDFLFNKLLWIYDYRQFDLKILKDIENSKLILDETKIRLIQILEAEIRDIFATKQHKNEASLYSIIKDWCETLDEYASSHMFNNGENKLLTLCFNITPDSQKFIEDLAKASIGLRIDDWSESTISIFIPAIVGFKTSIESYNEKMTSTNGRIANNGIYKISFIDEVGNEKFKTFDKTEYSNEAQLMYNDAQAMIEEYGESLSPNEKRQVLIDIINKL